MLSKHLPSGMCLTAAAIDDISLSEAYVQKFHDE